MIKKVRKSRSKRLQPIESSEGDCFGKHYDSQCQQCRMCHDDVLCMVVWQKKQKLQDRTIKLDNVPIEKIIKIADGESFDELLEAVRHYAGDTVDDSTVYDWFMFQLRTNKMMVDEDRIVRAR